MQTISTTPELLQTFVSYVPPLIARRFINNPAPLIRPVVERFPAAVLFADISGFTGLAEYFAQRGPIGAEELSSLLNTYFGQLVDLLISHGGEIIKFAGDAPIVLWPATSEDLPTTVHRAAQCGLAIQAKFHSYEVIEGLYLSLRMGIGAGEVLVASVGGVRDRWEFLVMGQPLTQMSIAEQQARPGDVVLSPEAWACIQDQCAGKPLLTGNLLLEALHNSLTPRPLAPVSLTPGVEVALRGYIPRAILARLDAGQTGWLAELRRVTVLFLNVIGLNYTAPDILDRVQMVMHVLQTVLYHYEGSVNQFLVDDKGTTLVAALGLPPVVHEDNPVRGVQAALAMQAELHQLKLRSAIGITTGRVFCGERGNALRREYAMIGDTVNLAARLMQIASHDLLINSGPAILCDMATYQASRMRLKFEILPEITIKGKAELITVYRPLSTVDFEGQISSWSQSTIHNPQPKTEIIGRVAERKFFAERLQALLQGVGSVVILEGEAGIGKSRLVSDLCQRARASGIASFIGAGDAVEKSAPYHAWRPIFSQLFSLDTFPEDSEARRKWVLSKLQANAELIKLAPLLNTILPLDLPENEITAQMAGQVRADNTRNLLLSLLQVSANSGNNTISHPYILILEDAHWLDSASWALTLAVSQHVRQILLVVVTRPMMEPLPMEYTQLLQLPGSYRLRLEVLPPEDAMAMVKQCLDVRTIPESVTELILEKADGHPFFSEELAYALRDAGLIVISDKRCWIAPDAGDLRTVNFPDTIQDVITSRIDRLTASQQLTLKVASVIGRVFASRILWDIYPIQIDKAQLINSLSHLEKLDIISLETPESYLTYTFKHSIVQEVIYNLLPFAQRHRLHRAVAEWYERTYADDLAPFYSLLVHHWSKAEIGSKTIDYLEKAGEQALRSGAYQEGLVFFSEALSRDTRKDKPADKKTVSLSLHHPVAASQLRWARWERKIGEAYLGLGRLRESRDHLEHAVVLSGWSMPTTQGKLVLSLLGQILRRLWQLGTKYLQAKTENSHQTCWRVLYSYSKQDHAALLEAARAYTQLAQLYYLSNEAIAAVNATFYTLNLVERAGLSPELVQVYANMCVVAGFIPLHFLAKTYRRRALEIVHKVHYLPTLAYVLMTTSIYSIGIGDWAEAQGALSRAAEINNCLKDRRRWRETLALQQQIAYYQGEFSRSMKLADDLYTAAQRDGNPLHRAWGLSGQAKSQLRLGRIEEAIIALETALILYAENTDHTSEITSYGLLAMAYLRQGGYRLARQVTEMAEKMLTPSPPTSHYLLEGYAGIAEVHLTLWELEQNPNSKIRLSARQACEALHKYARVFPIGQPRAWLWQGLYNWLIGKPSKAYKAWQKSLTISEQRAMLYEQGLAHYEIGRHLRADDPNRSVHLARSCEIFAKTGATYDLTRAQIALKML